jgi:hypothetical protein
MTPVEITVIVGIALFIASVAHSLWQMYHINIFPHNNSKN